MLRRLLDRLEGRWLDELAAVDACGAACADQGQPAPSTTSWLRARLYMGTSTASGWVRTAQTLFHGPLTGTAKALTDGHLSAAHAAVLATAPTTYPSNTAAEAEPVLLAAAHHLDPPRLQRVIAHLRLVADPDPADTKAERQYQQRGLWLAPTLDGIGGAWSPSTDSGARDRPGPKEGPKLDA